MATHSVLVYMKGVPEITPGGRKRDFVTDPRPRRMQTEYSEYWSAHAGDRRSR